MKRYIGIFLSLCMFLCGGCSQGMAPEQQKDYIYYVNADNTGLVQEEYTISDDKAKVQINDMLKALKKDTNSIDYKSAYPRYVKVNGWTLKDSDLEIDFSKEYKKMNAATELLLRAATVQSLVQLGSVDYVKFTIEGKELEDSKGNEIGYMGQDLFVTNTGSSLHGYQDGNIHLFFANASGDQLLEEEVHVRYNSNMSVEKLVVEQLKKGPSMQGRHPTISPQTKILGVSVRDGICYVNFDEEFLNTKYNVSPQVTVYSIVNSIVEGGAASQVQILVNGETNIVYKDSISLEKPFSRNLEIIEEEEK